MLGNLYTIEFDFKGNHLDSDGTFDAHLQEVGSGVSGSWSGGTSLSVQGQGEWAGGDIVLQGEVDLLAIE